MPRECRIAATECAQLTARSARVAASGKRRAIAYTPIARMP
jgi:hypothetical protein